MIVSATIQKLLATPSLTALLAYHRLDAGSHAIYANIAPQGTSSPFIVIVQADGEAVRHLMSMDAGLADALLDIEIYTEEGQGYGKAQQIKEEIRQALTNAKGDTWGTVDVSSCSLSDLRDSDYPPPEHGESHVMQLGWQANIWYSRIPVLA
jgi:hypothetical protein